MKNLIRHVSFLRSAFYEMHIFRYSRRKGTRADKMENQIPEETKAQRSSILSSLESQMTKEFRTKWTGACVKVLLEERQEINGVSYMVGHTPEYIKCAVETDAPDNTIIDAIIEGELTADVMKATVNKKNTCRIRRNVLQYYCLAGFGL